MNPAVAVMDCEIMTDGRGEDVTDRLPRGKLPIWQQTRYYPPNHNQHIGAFFS
jgi:hypothetical protein